MLSLLYSILAIPVDKQILIEQLIDVKLANRDLTRMTAKLGDRCWKLENELQVARQERDALSQRIKVE